MQTRLYRAAVRLAGAAGLILCLTGTAGAEDALSGWAIYGGLMANNAGLFTGGEVDHARFNLEVEGPTFTGPDWLNLRPVAGAGVGLAGDQIDYVYGGLAFTLLQYGELSLNGQIGAALHDADLSDDASGRELGCRALFHLGLGLDWRFAEHWSAELYADHLSNANLCDHNDGLETAGLRVGYHF